MKYEIICNGVVIAIFLSEVERDICLKHLSGLYKDCKFEENFESNNVEREQDE
jgi:hypothetical protein